MKEYIPIYPHSKKYAFAHDEKTAWMKSHRETIACREWIDSGLGPAFHARGLQRFTNETLEEFGMARVKQVLARTVQYKYYDGRFGCAAKEWAEGVCFPDNIGNESKDHRWESDPSQEYITDVHPAILNEMCSLVMDEERQQTLTPQQGMSL